MASFGHWHAEILWAADRLADGLRRADEVQVAELRWRANALVDLLRRHIGAEDSVLFTMVAQMLSDREYEDLAHAMHELLRSRGEPAGSAPPQSSIARRTPPRAARRKRPPPRGGGPIQRTPTVF